MNRRVTGMKEKSGREKGEGRKDTFANRRERKERKEGRGEKVFDVGRRQRAHYIGNFTTKKVNKEEGSKPKRMMEEPTLSPPSSRYSSSLPSTPLSSSASLPLVSSTSFHATSNISTLGIRTNSIQIIIN